MKKLIPHLQMVDIHNTLPMAYAHTQNMPDIELIQCLHVFDIEQSIPIIQRDDKHTFSVAYSIEHPHAQMDERNIQKFVNNPELGIKSLVNPLRFNILHECVEQYEANPNTPINHDTVHASDRITTILDAFALLTDQDMIQYIADNCTDVYTHEAFRYIDDDGNTQYYAF